MRLERRPRIFILSLTRPKGISHKGVRHDFREMASDRIKVTVCPNIPDTTKIKPLFS